MHTDFSGGSSGGLVFPSLSKFSTVCCDPHSQRLWIVNKAEIDVFLEPSCFLMIQQMLAIWSLVPLHFLKPAWTSGSSWFTFCWSLAWRIPWTEKPGRPQYIWLQRVRHDWSGSHKTKLDVFLEFSYFFHDLQMLAILSLVPLPFLNPACTSGSFQLKPKFKGFEHYLASMWNELNSVVVWTFFGIALLWDWNEEWPFPAL